MADNYSPGALLVDRGLPCGQSQDVFGRQALHVKIGNKPSEPLPVSVPRGTPKIYNLTCASKLVIYPQVLSANLKTLEIRARGKSHIKYAFEDFTLPTVPFLTIPAGSTKTLDSINFDLTTLYVQTSDDNEIVEIFEVS